MKQCLSILLALLILFLPTYALCAPNDQDSIRDLVPREELLDGEEIIFNDSALEVIIRNALKKEVGPVVIDDLLKITELSDTDHTNASNILPDGWIIEDLSVLQFCENLHTLYLYSSTKHNHTFTSIEALRNLKHLRDVTLFNCEYISDISPLTGHENIQSLAIAGSAVSDISAVTTMPNLIDLHIGWTQVKDISPLLQTNSLQYFYGGPFESYSPLTNHSQLKSVSLIGISREEFASLISAWDQLTCLLVENSQIVDDDLNLLANRRLITLDICSSPIEDITAVSSMKTLNDLRLINCGITDISPLEKLTNITYCLDLRDNNIKDITPLEGFQSLENIWLSPSEYYTGTEIKGMLPNTNVYIGDDLVE